VGGEDFFVADLVVLGELCSPQGIGDLVEVGGDDPCSSLGAPCSSGPRAFDSAGQFEHRLNNGSSSCPRVMDHKWTRG
jgi:hypothetical protein